MTREAIGTVHRGCHNGVVQKIPAHCSHNKFSSLESSLDSVFKHNLNASEPYQSSLLVSRLVCTELYYIIF